MSRFVVLWFARGFVCFACAAMAFAFWGCSHAPKPEAATPPPEMSPLALSITHVQTHPLYTEAARDCAQGRYDLAVPLLRQLTQVPNFTAQERAFAQQQLAICLSHTGQPAPKVVPLGALTALAPPPVSSPVRPEDADCGPRALLFVCQQMGMAADLPHLRQWAGTTKSGTTLAGLALAADKTGLKAEGVQVGREALAQVEMPALAWTNGNHFIAVLRTQGEGEDATATIHDPNQRKEETISQERLLRECSGYLLLLQRR